MNILIIAVLLPYIFLTTASGQDALDWGKNSPGASLSEKELGRDKTADGTVVTYNLYTRGLPADREYYLLSRPVGGNPEIVTSARIEKNGLVVSTLADPKTGTLADPINLKVFAGRGEPKDFALMSKDGTKAFVRFIPFPIRTDSCAWHLSLVMEQKDYTAISIVITGLRPNEEFHLRIQSDAEKKEIDAKAASNGDYKTLVLPAVKEQTSGRLTIDVSARNCSSSLTIPWGIGSYSIR